MVLVIHMRTSFFFELSSIFLEAFFQSPIDLTLDGVGGVETGFMGVASPSLASQSMKRGNNVIFRTGRVKRESK